ncbi:fatty acid desaturase [Streptomyces sp. Amel2xB2]|uniref:fatty acid desaturase family protein n=1 Tax=Streptomyces sp. Amel2xB2 TaxID=1305829 RepID=UPI000DBAB859|nr:acyl-CoA desaturase [Streptomyces sp. Amel2xB2]RAJ61852.1 fatty acid desaturase [Streptomyces sp. Amel2xB2]
MSPDRQLSPPAGNSAPADGTEPDSARTTQAVAAPAAAATASRTGGSDFARLSKQIVAAGLMHRRTGYYTLRITLVAALYALGWAAFLVLGESWWSLAVAGYLALVFGQTALVAHDVAHRQVFRRRRASERMGRIAGNLGIGMGYGWWQDKHTRHHANPNHEELDPDVAPDVLVWSQNQARSARGLPRLIGHAQAFLFFPLLALEGFNLHVAGVRALRNRSVKRRGLEGVMLFAHFGLYLTALFLVLPPSMALLFLAVHQCLFGLYLGSIFAPNHKGMPVLTGKSRPDFLRRQVLTSRNVRGGRFTDIALGGLNHQIEHHLFPSMPTPQLRKARPIVRQYCAELGVTYLETGFIASYRQALSSLHRAGAPLRDPEGRAQHG